MSDETIRRYELELRRAGQAVTVVPTAEWEKLLARIAVIELSANHSVLLWPGSICGSCREKRHTKFNSETVKCHDCDRVMRGPIPKPVPVIQNPPAMTAGPDFWPGMAQTFVTTVTTSNSIPLFPATTVTASNSIPLFPATAAYGTSSYPPIFPTRTNP